MPWRPAYHHAARLGCKVTIVTRDGHVLAAANWCSELPEQLSRMMGRGWQEYMEPADLSRLLAWFAMDEPGDPIVYRQLGACGGVCQPCRFCLVKARLPGGVWLAVGECEPVSPGPGPALPERRAAAQDTPR